MTSRSKKKILYLTNDLSGSHGWSTYALNLANEATRNGMLVHVAVEKEVYGVEGISQHAILMSPHALLWNPLNIAIQARRLSVLIQELKPDLIHVVSEPYIQPFSLLQATVPVILTIHGTYSRIPLVTTGGLRRHASNFFFKLAVSKVNMLISVSEATKKIFMAYVPWYPTSALSVISNSIRVKEYATDNVGIQRIDNNFSIITVGEVKGRKGIHETIDLFSEWARLHEKQITYHVVGKYNNKTGYTQYVQEQAEKAESAYFHTVFHGMVNENDKATLIAKSDLYVHLERVEDSSDMEGFGIGIIEAAGYGVPALVASGSATTEAVKDGISGYVIDLNDRENIYTTIDKLLIKKTLKKNEIKEWARAHSPELMFIKMNKIYESIE